LQEEVQLGGIVGAAMPKIGIGNGILAGTLHQLAILMISGKCPAEVAEYHKHLAQQKIRMDLELETKLFGCTSLQVGHFTNRLPDHTLKHIRALDPN
jgi:hypothetical protein